MKTAFLPSSGPSILSAPSLFSEPCRGLGVVVDVHVAFVSEHSELLIFSTLDSYESAVASIFFSKKIV